MKKFIFTGILITMLLAHNAYPFPKRETAPPPPAIENERTNERTIIGRIVMFGNEPFSYAGIVDQEGIEYFIYPREEGDSMRMYQGHLIRFIVISVQENPSYESSNFRGGQVRILSWSLLP